ncbi:MAG: bifunctional diaminohydroxyphosphoribosylaminopyrimidine deaminase/5-amino-6-(5-phosphoribosylamino)uracil reductase RibD [Deltaproteobacteria bacterium]|nr:bifunctional diaminohydroxyphosphoribosylaminopyrimidine deaminase/5-amino-6-(5-phosphoribosylamino)uracil reductase RibD [Deltaproteobacteria bacterium]
MSGPLRADHPRHRELMQVALRRAVRALGRTRPNPCVGAVVARDGHILSVGHHARAGTAHAEVIALRKAGPAARGADLYVTLEPCNHHGRTPPCTDAVLQAGIARAFVAIPDDNPRVTGGGIARLRAAGVEVHVGLLAGPARDLVSGFFMRCAADRPEVILKAAVSVDGRLATAAGQSAGLSGPRAHAWLHRLRDRVDGILVGAGTVAADSPRLTARRPPLGARGRRDWVRIIVDSALRTAGNPGVWSDPSAPAPWFLCAVDAPQDAVDALRTRGATVHAVPRTARGLDLRQALGWLGAQGLTRLLVEGGAQIHGSLLADRLADRVALVVTPRLLGDSAVPMARWSGPDQLDHTIVLEHPTWRRLGEDTLLEGMVRYRE